MARCKLTYQSECQYQDVATCNAYFNCINKEVPINSTRCEDSGVYVEVASPVPETEGCKYNLNCCCESDICCAKKQQALDDAEHQAEIKKLFDKFEDILTMEDFCLECANEELTTLRKEWEKR